MTRTENEPLNSNLDLQGPVDDGLRIDSEQEVSETLVGSHSVQVVTGIEEHLLNLIVQVYQCGHTPSRHWERRDQFGIKAFLVDTTM